MDNYQTMLKVCMFGIPIFTTLAILCGFGWNYYGLKIKEADAVKQKDKITSKDTPQSRKDVYNIHGDLVLGDKRTVINNNDGGNEKLIEAFEKLKSSGYPQRNIAIDYIINNFPKTLSRTQIKDLIASNPVFASNFSETQKKLCTLLATQKKSDDLKNYFKQIISYDASNSIAWHYLLREDIAIDFPYVFSVIKDKPNHCLSYANIVQYAMEIDDGRVCTELLNSHDLVDFLISNPDEQRFIKQITDWTDKMIERKSSYKKYKNTYFFQAVAI
jgi:hypothetical protein